MAASGGAQASSFVSLGSTAPAEGGSILVLGAPPGNPAESPSITMLPDARPERPLLASLPAPKAAAAARQAGTDGAWVPPLAFPLDAMSGTAIVPISASVVAIGDPPVTGETVASVEPEPKTQAKRKTAPPEPMVIRGGLVGEAFATAAPVAPTAPSEPAAAATPAAAQRPRDTAAAPQEAEPPAEAEPAEPPPVFNGPLPGAPE